MSKFVIHSFIHDDDDNDDEALPFGSLFGTALVKRLRDEGIMVMGLLMLSCCSCAGFAVVVGRIARGRQSSTDLQPEQCRQTRVRQLVHLSRVRLGGHAMLPPAVVTDDVPSVLVEQFGLATTFQWTHNL